MSYFQAGALLNSRATTVCKFDVLIVRKNSSQWVGNFCEVEPDRREQASIFIYRGTCECSNESAGLPEILRKGNLGGIFRIFPVVQDVS